MSGVHEETVTNREHPEGLFFLPCVVCPFV